MAAAAAQHFVACQSRINNSARSRSSGTTLPSKNRGSSNAAISLGQIAYYQGLRSIRSTNLGQLQSHAEANFKHVLRKALSGGYK